MDFADVYDRYFARVYGYARLRVESREAADDVVSRVFERVLDKLPSYRPERGPLEPWLFTVARNAVADHFRSRATAALPLDAAERAPEPGGGVEAGLVEAEERARLLAALRRLDEREREVLALKFQAGFSHEEIAGLLELGVSHVGVIVFRAVRKLKDKA